MNNTSIPIPKRMAHLPLWHGYPIPYTNMVTDGRPDFRVLDVVKHRACVEFGQCGVCGGELGRGPYFFIGGAKSMESRTFHDPAMHRECAYYAARVCPYLAGTKREYAAGETQTEQRAELAAMVVVEQPRPERMGLMLATGYDIVHAGSAVLIRAHAKGSKIDWNIMPPSRPKDA